MPKHTLTKRHKTRVKKIKKIIKTGKRDLKKSK